MRSNQEYRKNVGAQLFVMCKEILQRNIKLDWGSGKATFTS